MKMNYQHLVNSTTGRHAATESFWDIKKYGMQSTLAAQNRTESQVVKEPIHQELCYPAMKTSANMECTNLNNAFRIIRIMFCFYLIQTCIREVYTMNHTSSQCGVSIHTCSCQSKNFWSSLKQSQPGPNHHFFVPHFWSIPCLANHKIATSDQWERVHSLLVTDDWHLENVRDCKRQNLDLAKK